jgi:hypothetical protein
VIVWVVVQVKSDDGSVFEIGGIYSTEALALAACTERTDCMWPVTVDLDLGRETTVIGVYPVTGGPQ